MKLTDERIAQARKMREEGMSQQKIAAALDVGRGVIRCALNPEIAQKECLRAAEYRRTHKEKVREYHRTHKEEKRLYHKRYYKAHKEKILLYGKAHKAEHCLHNAKYRKTHKNDEVFRKRGQEACRRWRKTHSSETAALSAARHALILGATIGNLAEIKEIYRQAKESPKIRCYLCGKLIPKGHRHVDHIMPLSEGGVHRPSNLAVACDDCNFKKSSKLPEEVGILL